MPYITPAARLALQAKGVFDQDIRDMQAVVGARADGDPGPNTIAAVVQFLKDQGHLPRPRVALPEEARARVVAIALDELGGGTSKEQDPQKYIRDAAPPYIGLAPNAKAWCGIFWLWCLRQAGLTTRTWKDGSGFALGYLPIVGLPEPGDGMYFGVHHQQYR